MDYKKEYEEMVQRVKELHETGNFLTKKQMEIICPELAESEDDRIRKCLSCLTSLDQSLDVIEDMGLTRQQLLAWLEKQKNSNDMAFHEGYTLGFDDGMKEKKQKPEIRVKIPKFRVGDIVQHNPLEKWDRSRKIVSIDECGYNFDLSHLGDTVSGGSFDFVFENEYELVEQKPAEWSEEDKKLIDNVINSLCCYQNTLSDYQKEIVGEEIRKLKSLKPLSKQEWSEEDEKMRNQLIYDIERYKKEGLISAKQQKATKALYDGIEKCYDEKIDWLKSLRPQPHWKPSEEQMEALLWCTAHLGGADHRVLAELYEHLKML